MFITKSFLKKTGLVLLMGAAVAARADTVYVDDDNVCGSNTPCYAVLQDAADAVLPPATVLIYPGTYEGVRFENPVGDLTVQALDDAGAPAKGTVIITETGHSGLRVLAGRADDIAIHGLTITSTVDNGITLFDFQSLEMSGLVVSNNGDRGMHIDVENSGTIVMTDIVANGNTGGTGIALDMKTPNGVHSISLSDVQASNNSQDGININSSEIPQQINVVVDDITVMQNSNNGLYVEAQNGSITATNIIANGNDNGVNLENADSLTITHSEANGNQDDGFELEASEIVAAGLEADGNGSAGIEMDEISLGEGSVAPFEDGLIACSIVTNNATGISGEELIASSSLVIRQSNIETNNTVGVLNKDDSAVDGEITADGNWWGSDTGPTHTNNPGGTGAVAADSINVVGNSGGIVTFDNFAAAPFEITDSCIAQALSSGPAAGQTTGPLRTALLALLLSILGAGGLSRLSKKGTHLFSS